MSWGCSDSTGDGYASFCLTNQFKSKSKFLLHLPAKTWVQALGVLRFSFVGENDITNTPETVGNAENVAPKIGDTINCPERNTTFPRAQALKVKDCFPPQYPMFPNRRLESSRSRGWVASSSKSAAQNQTFLGQVQAQRQRNATHLSRTRAPLKRGRMKK